jgi:sigma-B regulation protein RsbU (phosphoserine phosphatase)
MLRSLAETHYGPGEVLTRLNRLLVEDFPHGKYVTMIYGVLDPASRILTFSNAGHLLPLLVVEGKKVQCPNTDRGMPLGLGFGSFSELEVPLPERSRLVFYSDGITEAENVRQEEYGRLRLEAHVMQPDACPETVLQDVRSFVDGARLRDDATVIFVKA